MRLFRGVESAVAAAGGGGDFFVERFMAGTLTVKLSVPSAYVLVRTHDHTPPALPPSPSLRRTSRATPLEPERCSRKWSSLSPTGWFESAHAQTRWDIGLHLSVMTTMGVRRFWIFTAGLADCIEL